MNDIIYTRNCPNCGNSITYNGKLAKYLCKYAANRGNLCRKCCNSGKNNPNYGNSYDTRTRKKMSLIVTERYKDLNKLNEMSAAVKTAMHRPDIRKKHLNALRKSKWLKVKTDVGQLELLNKWNRLGFKFEPNYQIHTDTDLFYVDGYDAIHNIVLEYDTKYHKKISQQIKDEVRQKRIIDILHPKKFWRYDAENKIIAEVANV